MASNDGKEDVPSQEKTEDVPGAEGGQQIDTDDLMAKAEALREYLAKSLSFSSESAAPKPVSRLDSVDFEGIAKYIKSDKCKNIVTMAGAGISTSAGIPDFRSPGTGLYDNLQKYKLPSPQSVFDISYFEENPEPFFMLSKELWPGTFKPTLCHYFLKLLDKKGKLSQHFTQNIDTLERVAGLDEDKLVEAHGTFNTGHCRKCSQLYTQQWMKDKIFSGASPIPKCEKTDCDGVIKPDIVFFGESLPPKFILKLPTLETCDLLIILGTSLVVQPFASLTSRVKEDVPRLYINLEITGGGGDMMFLFFGNAFNFDGEDNIRDVFWQGTCDDGCAALADLLGWGDELRKFVQSEHAKIDKNTPSSGKGAVKTSTTSPKKGPAKTSNTSPTKGAATSSKGASPASASPCKDSKSDTKGSPSKSNRATPTKSASKDKGK